MQLVAKLTILAAFIAAGDALFTPRCLWGGLLGEPGGSGESSERWIRGTSLRTKGSRVRRFLWTDKDVCEWMCRDDYGSEVRDVCRRCCPDSAAGSTQQPPRTPPSRRPSAWSTSTEQQGTSPGTSPGTSRAPRSTTSGDAGPTSVSGETPGTTGTAGTTGETSTTSAQSTPAAATTTTTP